MSHPRTALARIGLAAVPLALLTACGSASTDEGSGREDRLEVTAAFYPLQWAAERVGADLVRVRALTPPGAEPHDLELTPRDVGELAGSDVVVYLAGFQPAVDDAVTAQAADAAFDVSPVATLASGVGLPGSEHDGESEEEHQDHADAAAPVRDPHFWLDPVRLQDVVLALGDHFADADPEHAASYRSAAEDLVQDLATLDQEFQAGLASCRNDRLVTAHTAFGYLAQRYGLTQEGISGLSPGAEPDAAALRDLAARVRDEGVTTVYAEALLSPAVAETLARETGAGVAVLDPLEGLTEDSSGSDYLEVMRSNLEVLREGQQCR